MKSILGWVVATILGFILLQKSCNDKDVSVEVVKTKIDTMYMARPTQTKYITTLVPVNKYYTDTIINNVDTSHVINEFYATSEYDDTIRFDKAKVAIRERITQNMIISRMASIDISNIWSRFFSIIQQERGFFVYRWYLYPKVFQHYVFWRL